jgi:hypothetical protein
MPNLYIVAAKFFVLVSTLSVFDVLAQEQESASSKSETAAPVLNAKDPAEIKGVPVSKQPAKKMVQDATITLQTTITGNQEQPRVLYILPWQSPTATDVDFESLDNEQKAVFGHIEREELRRELESSDVIQ